MDSRDQPTIERKARLATALRDNLRRRKLQVRRRRAAGRAPAHEAAPAEKSGNGDRSS
jgi:hypothetical protein